MHAPSCSSHCRHVQIGAPPRNGEAGCLPRLSRQHISVTVAAAAIPSRLAEQHHKKQQRRHEANYPQECPTDSSDVEKHGKRVISRARVKDKQSRKQRRASPIELSKRSAVPEGARPCEMHWRSHHLPDSSSFLEYIPGRDDLYSSGQLAAGLSASDASTGEHILQTHPLPRGVLRHVTPFVLRGVQMFRDKQLPDVTDGRASGGPVDIAAFLARPAIQKQVEQAMQSRAARLRASGKAVPKKGQMMPHVVHVSPDGRKVFIGDEHSVTRNGTRIMSLPKAWKGNTLTTWVGGMRLTGAADGHPPSLLASHLSSLLAMQEGGLVDAANLLWDLFAAEPATAEAAKRMLEHIRGSKIRQQSALGRTGWNGYVFNVSFRTGPHVDGKNVAGSYSALMVVEIGDAVAGGFYMLPQYRAALDLRQGLVMFHRSDDRRLGLHGNSAMHVPDQRSHRVALVFYQTDLKVDEDGDLDTDETVLNKQLA